VYSQRGISIKPADCLRLVMSSAETINVKESDAASEQLHEKDKSGKYMSRLTIRRAGIQISEIIEFYYT